MKSNRITNSQVSVRLPMVLFATLAAEAEVRKTSLAEAARACLAEHFNHVQIDAKLTSIEQKLDQLLSSFELAAE